MITIPDVRLGKRWEGVIEEKGNSLPWIYHRTSNPKGKLNKTILISGTCIMKGEQQVHGFPPKRSYRQPEDVKQL